MKILQIKKRPAHCLFFTLLSLALVTDHSSALASHSKAKAKTKSKPQATSTVSFSGEATVVALTHVQVGGSVIIGQTGQLPSSGGNLALTLGSTNISANGVTNALTCLSEEALSSG